MAPILKGIGSEYGSAERSRDGFDAGSFLVACNSFDRPHIVSDGEHGPWPASRPPPSPPPQSAIPGQCSRAYCPPCPPPPFLRPYSTFTPLTPLTPPPTQLRPHLRGRRIQRPPLRHHDHPNIPILQRLPKVRLSLAHPARPCHSHIPYHPGTVYG